MTGSSPRHRSVRYGLSAVFITGAFVLLVVFWPKPSRPNAQPSSSSPAPAAPDRATPLAAAPVSVATSPVIPPSVTEKEPWSAEYRRLIDSKDTVGLVALARRLETGDEKDPRSAREILLKAAALGSPEATRHLGRFAEQGLVDPPDGPSAIRWYQAAADQGDVPSTVALGRIHLENKLVPVDLEKAESFLRSAVAADNAEAMYLLAAGVLLHSAGGADSAIALLEKSAGLGNSEAKRLLARISASGEFGPADPARALELARTAAKSGSPDAMVDLARLLLSTRPDKVAMDEAVSNLLEAGAANSSRGQLEIARMFVSLPELSAANANLALDYALKAWNGGESEAAMVLAAAYVAVGDMRSAQDMVIRYGTRVRDWRSLYAFSLYSTDKLELSAAIAKANAAEIGDHVAHSLAPLPPSMVFNASGGTQSRTTVDAVPVSTPAPHYPSGLATIVSPPTRITVEFDIGVDGRTQGARVLDAIHPQAAEAAVVAVAQWRFQPTTLVSNGRAVGSKMRMPLSFVTE